MFNENQLKVLSQELDSNRIKTREKGNINLSYLEGFDIIETANNIFGFGNWDYAISKLEFISSEMNHNQNHVICYKVILKISVLGVYILNLKLVFKSTSRYRSHLSGVVFLITPSAILLYKGTVYSFTIILIPIKQEVLL